MPIIITYTLWISFAIQIFFFVYFYIRVLFKNKKNKSLSLNKPVSVIISAKNEETNLKDFLPKVLNQNYPLFEVVVVNDMSNDGTEDILNSFSQKNKNITIVKIDKNLKEKGKKNALTAGINASKYEYLLFTDADCYPVSKNWIKSVMSSYKEKTEIILAYGAYEKSLGLLNKLIRYDTLTIALKYMSFANAGLPYMGVGRNLSYKKSVFLKNKGFQSHKHIKSGDDDLFVNEVANKTNTEIVIDYESVTVSVPKKTWKEFIKQKKRHLTTGFFYKNVHKLLFGFESASVFFFYFSILYFLFLKSSIFLIVLLYFIRLGFQVITDILFSNKLKEKKNLIFIPIFDVLIPIVNLYAIISYKFTKETEWK